MYSHSVTFLCGFINTEMLFNQMLWIRRFSIPFLRKYVVMCIFLSLAKTYRRLSYSIDAIVCCKYLMCSLVIFIKIVKSLGHSQMDDINEFKCKSINVNGLIYQCHTHTVPETYGKLLLFLSPSLLSSFFPLLLLYFSHSLVTCYFQGALIV